MSESKATTAAEKPAVREAGDLMVEFQQDDGHPLFIAPWGVIAIQQRANRVVQIHWSRGSVGAVTNCLGVARDMRAAVQQAMREYVDHLVAVELDMRGLERVLAKQLEVAMKARQQELRVLVDELVEKNLRSLAMEPADEKGDAKARGKK